MGFFNNFFKIADSTRSTFVTDQSKLLNNHHYNDVIPRNSFIDNVFRDKVTPKKGSILVCDLAGAFDHSGVYIGDEIIIHRSGDGYIERTTPKEFLNRLNGRNNAISIYVGCIDTEPIYDKKIYERALNSINDDKLKGYDLINKNCHMFVRHCITGEYDDNIIDFTFVGLENMLKSKYGLNNWRVWDLDYLNL